VLESIFTFLIEKWPLIAIGSVLVYCTYKITDYISHWKERVKKTEDDCKKIDSHIMPKLDIIGSSITSLNGSFNNLVIHLGAKDSKLNTAVFMMKSPLQLTQLGIDILAAIGGKKYIDEHVERLVAEMDLIGVKTALDSQTIAPLIINKVSTEDSFTAIKNFAYQTPIYKTKGNTGEEVAVTLDMSTISNIMGIYLRDKYLDKHPELNPADI
jgi:hypothetical protein